MLRDFPETEAIGGNAVIPNQPQTQPQTKLNPRKLSTKPTHTRLTVTDPAKCVFTQQILAIRQAEKEGKRSLAEAMKAKLLTMSRGFIRRAATKFYGDDIEQDDVDATATLAYWRAVMTWQPDAGSPFDTWARWGMRMELQKLVRASRMIRGQKQERVSLASLDGDDDVEGDLPPDERSYYVRANDKRPFASPTITYLTHQLDCEADRTRGELNEQRVQICFKQKFGRWPTKEEMDAAMTRYRTPTDGAA